MKRHGMFCSELIKKAFEDGYEQARKDAEYQALGGTGVYTKESA